MTRRSRRSYPTAVAVLARARQLIASEACDYVCWAIEKAHHQLYNSKKSKPSYLPKCSPAGRLLERIDEALGLYTTVTSWLVREHGAPAKIHLQYDHPLAREYRLRWLDALIKEYSK